MTRAAPPLLALLLLAVAATAAPTPVPGESAASAATCADAVTLAPTALPPPIPQPCPGIRPGALLSNGCTMNWVWEATANGDRDLYVGTAGHCAGMGAVMGAPGIGRFGVVVFRVNEGIGRDFALIHVDEEKEALVNPSLCHWGGPTGVLVETQGADRLERVAYHYGNGAHTNGDARQKARVGVSTTFDGSVSFVGAASPGDSGSPVMMRNGLAWGVVTHTALVGPAPGVLTFGTGMGSAQLFVRQALGLDLALVTAPLA